MPPCYHHPTRSSQCRTPYSTHIRLVPNDDALAEHGATPEGFFNLMEGYVQKSSKGLLKIPHGRLRRG